LIPRIAVVPTHDRPAELARLLDALAPQCHAVFVVDNASTPPVSLPDWHPSREVLGMRQFVIRDEEQPPNLSRLWNVGLDAATAYVRGGDVTDWDVAVFNDDAVPPPGWWDAVSGAMRRHGAAAGCADPFDSLPPGTDRVWFDDAPMSVGTRLAGWAFMLRGELGMRADERLRWWAADDLLSLQARQSGGLVHVGGFPVPNTGANTSTVGVLAEQAGQDMATFVEITGRRPW
jgi:glycosyltransferase involved in cell wall biosynthesis